MPLLTLSLILVPGSSMLEKDATVIGVNTKIAGDSVSIFAGVELPIYKRLFAYVDVSGTPMKVEKRCDKQHSKCKGYGRLHPCHYWNRSCSLSLVKLILLQHICHSRGFNRESGLLLKPYPR